MRLLLQMLALVLKLVFTPGELFAQPIDPSGRWEGAIQSPMGDAAVVIDIARNDRNQLVGAYSEASGVKGLPLSAVILDGRSLRFVLKPGTGGGTFAGDVAADGKGISGEFVANDGGHILPFVLTRTGDARMPEAVRSKAVTKSLAGSWEGLITMAARQLRIVIRITNLADSAAEAGLSADGGVEIPAAVVQDGNNVSLRLPSTGITIAGTLNVDGTAIAATFNQGRGSVPVTFTRK